MSSSKREIISVDPLHTAKTLVLVYMCFSLPVIGLFFIDAYFRYGEIPLFVVLYGVFLNIVFGFAILWLACKVYNWVAAKFGGIELALLEIPDDETSVYAKKMRLKAHKDILPESSTSEN